LIGLGKAELGAGSVVNERSHSFMADPALAASVLPMPGEEFDIPAFRET
jgi:hypothetical protein